MEDECYICLEPIKNNIALLNCGHKYHFDCISQWINKKNDYRHVCVVCRDIETEIISIKDITEEEPPTKKKENIVINKSFFDNFFCCNIL